MHDGVVTIAALTVVWDEATVRSGTADRGSAG